MPTLRSWELRYGIPVTTRASGTHRRYSAEELHALRLMRDEIARGTRAGAAAQAVRASLGQSGPAADFVAAVLEASGDYDAPAIRDQLDAAASELGLAGCLDDVLFPALRQVGEWWQIGRCDVDQERLTTEAVRAWLDRLMSYAPSPIHADPSCWRADLATSTRWASRRCVCPCAKSVGAAGCSAPAHHRLRSPQPYAPTEPSRSSSRRTSPRPGNVPSAHCRQPKELGVAVFYAGNAFATPRSRVKVPGRYLGPRIKDACDLIVASLPDA